jgi:hypothetical protein
MANVSCSKTENSEGVWIRVVNVSDYDYKNVIIYSTAFGDVDARDRSQYTAFDMAYRYSFVSLDIDGENYSIIPIDYVGEQTLENGNYSFLIDIVSVDNKSLIQTLVKDD